MTDTTPDSGTPIADGVLADQQAAQDAHDVAVPEVVPDAPAAPATDDADAAVFVAATDPADSPVPDATVVPDTTGDAPVSTSETSSAFPSPMDRVNVNGPDPSVPVAPAVDVPVPDSSSPPFTVVNVDGPDPYASTSGDMNDDDALYALVKDTNDRIRNMETVVSGFMDDAKPMLEKLGHGGISGLLGVMFGGK
jgi:hypothetical protein